jgi:hypothetical protein
MSKKRSKKIGHDAKRQFVSAIGAIREKIADVRFIRLERGSASREDKVDSVPNDPSQGKYSIELSTTYNQDGEGKKWVIQLTTFELTAFFKTVQQPIVISAKYAVGFELKVSAEPPTQEEAKVLGQVVTLPLIWNFWREFAQSMTVRLGFPAITIPLHHSAMTGEWKESPSSQ